MTTSQRPKALKTTVTYLEMTEPPKTHFPLPMNTQAAVMQARNIPLHFYRYLQLRTGRQWHWVYRLRLDDDALSRIVHSDKTSISVLYLDGAPAGFFELFRESSSTIDLAYFGLMPHAIGRGLGKWFLTQAVSSAWASKPARVTVNTNALDHRAALPLYQRIGFRPVSQTEALIQPLGDEDLLRLAKRD